MRWRARNFALLAMPLLEACDTTVVLGTDCPPLRGACTLDAGALHDAASHLDADTSSDVSDAAQGERDAGTDATDELDAADPLDGDSANDAEADVGPGIFPDFQNPSFELRGDGGVGDLLALEMPSPIAPWYACRTGLSVVSSARAGTTSIEPTEGQTFLGDSFPIVALNLNGLNQDFSPPLKAGQRYSFVVDLWSESALSRSILELEVASGGCIPPIARLTASEVLPNGGWQRHCLSFTPARDVTTLVLMVTAPEEYLNIGARLYLDNLRSEPDCQ